jgi:hypothetical protein
MSLRCAEPLSKGRTCCHVRGHDRRHSHTWHRGDARFETIGNRVINLETAELAGESAEVKRLTVKYRAERTSPRNVLAAYSPAFASEPTGRELPPDDYVGPWRYWCPHEDHHDMWRCNRCNYGIEMPAYEQDTITGGQTVDDVSYYFRANSGRSYGITTDGHDVRRDDATGRISRMYSMTQKRDAVEVVREYGLSAASRKLDIPRPTLKSWATRGLE